MQNGCSAGSDPLFVRDNRVVPECVNRVTYWKECCVSYGPHSLSFTYVVCKCSDTLWKQPGHIQRLYQPRVDGLRICLMTARLQSRLPARGSFHYMNKVTLTPQTICSLS